MTAPLKAGRRLLPIIAAAIAPPILLCIPAGVSAQTVEVSPFGGYRFGGDFFELAAGGPLDLDGAPVVGGALNVDLGDGLSFEAIYTHQQAGVDVPGGVSSPPARVRAVVDHWLAGGRQEFGAGRARPYLTGLLGLTRFGAAGDNEVRFTVAAGGGGKLRLAHRLALRLDGRVFTTFVDLDARAVACGRGTCLVGVNVNVVWQAEFTAGLVVIF
jgi:hypothetical protein